MITYQKRPGESIAILNLLRSAFGPKSERAMIMIIAAENTIRIREKTPSGFLNTRS